MFLAATALSLPCVFANTQVVRTEPELRLRTSVGITFAPATISVVANIERDSRNRTLTIEADSSTYFRASTVQLDGDAEAVTQQFWFKSLPAGEYDIRGRLERSGGDTVTASRHVSIRASGMQP